LKFNSDAFPKESLVKTPINNMFNTKISRKKGNDNFTRTKGIRIAEKVVAILGITRELQEIYSTFDAQKAKKNI